MPLIIETVFWRPGTLPT